MNVRNLPELHRRTAEALGPRVALRHKQFGCYRDVTWSEYREQVEACAATLINAGIQPGERVGLLAENRVEWLIADLAILAAGAITVPLHAPLTAPQCQYQLADAGTVWLFVSTPAQLAKVRAIRAEAPLLRGVVVFDPIECDDAQTWRAFLQRGRMLRSSLARKMLGRETQLGSDDVATII